MLADSGDDQRDQRIEQTVEIQRGANKWSLSLATGTLEGEAPANALLAHTWTSASGATCITHFLVDAQGRFHVDGVPAGAGRVQVVRANTDFEPVNLDVIAGDVTHVSVR